MDRKDTRNPLAAGLFLIGLGVLAWTGWWWPGIMVVLGISIGAGLVFRGRYREGIVTAAILFSIPLVTSFLTNTDIPWDIFVPMMLIGAGVVVLIKAFYLREA